MTNFKDLFESKPNAYKIKKTLKANDFDDLDKFDLIYDGEKGIIKGETKEIIAYMRSHQNTKVTAKEMENPAWAYKI